MNIKRITITITLLQVILFAKCDNAVSYDIFLKEMTKNEEQVKLLSNKIQMLTIDNLNLKEQLRNKEKNRFKNNSPKAIKTSSSKAKKTKKETIKQDEIYKVTSTVAEVFYKNSNKTKQVYKLIKNERVEIDRCDKVGWCKLKGKKFYVKKENIEIVKDN